MRRPRLLVPDDHPEGCYHLVSRIVDRQFALNDPALKAHFLRLVREEAAFCGIHLLTYCLMDNHFHLLVRVPRRPEALPSAQETLDALGHLSTLSAGAQRQLGEQLLRGGDPARLQEWVERINRRRWSLAAFMKEVKQRFSRHYNRLHERKGTLWEDRFKSVVVEGAGHAMVGMAAYIDLNPVRARIVEDAKDYRWNGYAEALAGDKRAREGLAAVVRALGAGKDPGSAEAVLAEYRQYLALVGAEGRDGLGEDGRPLRGSMKREDVLEVLAKKGRLPAQEYWRVRVRYMTDGVAVGSRTFIEGLFQKNRSRFGPRRRSGARLMRGLEGPKLYTLRALRVRVFE